jgi:hypothetical protein
MQAGSRPRWLAEAAATGICPLCLAVEEFEADYLMRFCQELEDPSCTISGFVRSRGFCFDHSQKFELALNLGNHSVDQALGLYLSVLDALITELRQLEHDAWLQAADCPLCVSRDQHLVVCAHHLMHELSRVDETARPSLRDPSLCVGHFEMAWVVSAEHADRGSLRDLQLSGTAQLAERIRTILSLDAGSEDVRRGQAVAISKRAANAISGWTVTPR